MRNRQGECSRPNCATKVDSTGLCSSHYRMGLRLGWSGYVDSAPVIAHLEKLRDLGWSSLLIGRHVGVCHTVPARIMRVRPKVVRMATSRAMLSIPLIPGGARFSASIVGTRRRSQALNWMGWSNEMVSTRADLRGDTLAKLLHRGKISHASALAVAKVYVQICDQTGPSSRSAAIARSRGYAPPFAWEDLDMDDPATRPNLTGYDEGTVQALLRGAAKTYDRADLDEAVRRLRGIRVYRMAAQMKLTPHVVYHAHRRVA